MSHYYIFKDRDWRIKFSIIYGKSYCTKQVKREFYTILFKNICLLVLISACIDQRMKTNLNYLEF
jgi:hypothetical protein